MVMVLITWQKKAAKMIYGAHDLLADSLHQHLLYEQQHRCVEDLISERLDNNGERLELEENQNCASLNRTNG